MLAVDEDLRHRHPAAGAGDHFGTLGAVGIDIDVGEFDALPAEQGAGAGAIAAPLGSIELDLGHLPFLVGMAEYRADSRDLELRAKVSPRRSSVHPNSFPRLGPRRRAIHEFWRADFFNAKARRRKGYGVTSASFLRDPPVKRGQAGGGTQGLRELFREKFVDGPPSRAKTMGRSWEYWSLSLCVWRFKPSGPRILLIPRRHDAGPG